MPSTSTEVVTDSFDPVFRGGEYFDITHFSRDPCGFAITAEGARHSLPNDQAVLRAIENGVPYLSKRQLEERNADRTHPENHVDPIENATRPHGLSLTPEEKDNLKTAMHGEPKDNGGRRGNGGEYAFTTVWCLAEPRPCWLGVSAQVLSSPWGKLWVWAPYSCWCWEEQTTSTTWWPSVQVS
jgi:hypothetical protein